MLLMLHISSHNLRAHYITCGKLPNLPQVNLQCNRLKCHNPGAHLFE